MLKPYFTDDLIEAGCDEVGRGCLAGSVVAAAVILPKDYKNEFLTDSKKLTQKKREILEIEIKKEAIAWAIGEASVAEIDEINILNASFLAMHRAIEALNQRPEFLLIDGNRFQPYLGISHECVVKGDSKFLSIAAASILAKVYRDKQMSEFAKEYPFYAWDANAGYPTKKHREGIKKHGITSLHRKSFKLLAE